MAVITDRIVSMLPQFTKKQRELGRYICDNIYEVALMSAPAIARSADVGEATLTRFVYALGYRNFQSFQLDLRKQTQGQAPFTQEDIAEQGAPVYERVFVLDRNLIDETRSAVDPDEFDVCVDILATAKSVLVLGDSVSKFASGYFAEYLSIMRNGVSLANQLGLGFFGDMQALGPKSVVLALSLPRYPKATLKMVDALGSRGIPVIGITDSPVSPLASMSRHILFTPTRYFTFVHPMAPTFSLLHALLVGIYQKSPKAAKMRFDAYEQEIIDTDMFEYKDYNFSRQL